MFRRGLKAPFAVLLAALLVSCGSASEPDAAPDSGALPADGGLAADDGGSGPSEVIGGPLPLTLTSYRHVRDSDGSATIDGGETWLAFHASGAAFLVPATDDDGLSYEGTHFEGAGKVTVHFAADAFARDGEFAFDPSATQVTLPFKVFNEGPGSSTWERAEEAELLPG